ncbi:MAG: uracil-DNA glycosylase [Calditrichia bacterium]
MSAQLMNDWRTVLADELARPYILELEEFVAFERLHYDVFPPEKNVFGAFNACAFDDVRVVILGQDPYHGPNQAHGLSFSVNDGIKHPPSLRNIFKEIEQNLGLSAPESGNLTRWAEQGVLLLNSVLTVRANEAASHKKHGWETFTDTVIRELSERRENLVFMLWGNYAKKKGRIINRGKHVVLESGHPSPLSVRYFRGCGHFSRVNEFLREKELPEIVW